MSEKKDLKPTPEAKDTKALPDEALEKVAGGIAARGGVEDALIEQGIMAVCFKHDLEATGR